jgi:glycosyltransferase involved in cell wall biosynthesis
VQQAEIGWLTSRSGDPIFWTPERLGRPSAWWGHVPFAFWLTAQCKPRLLVELGTHSGVSYAAFCETVLRLGLPTRCFAVDTWRGDAQAGHYGAEVYADLAEFHARRYSAFSQLLRQTFDEASDEFADATIDLLHIDGCHTYEAVRHDFDTWRPKLSERAVVLFHDTNERRGDFGVWRLFDELRRDAPSFEFLHCHGLGVLAFGEEPPEAVKALCALAADDEVAATRERFSHLGARWMELDVARDEKAAAAERERRLQETVAERDAQIVRSQNELARADENADGLIGRITELEAIVADKSARVAQAELDSAEARAQIEALANRAERLEGASRQRIAELEAIVAAKSAQADRAERDLAETRAQVEELAEHAERLEEANRQTTDRCDALTNETIRQREEHVRALATLKRPDYDGRLPAKLAGLKRWIPGRRRKFRRLARDYRLVAASPLFDPEWYLANNPDVAGRGVDPVYHYLRYGAAEGRAPGPHFSGQAYTQANSDVAESGENPLLHFLRDGAREGRSFEHGLATATPQSPVDPASYREWVRRYDTLSEADRQAISRHLARLSYQPLISVVMPAYETPKATLRQAIESVRGQLYQNWELCVADDASPSATVSAVLAEFAALDHRIKWVRRLENGHISAASNSALELARGEFVALMDHDDTIPPQALYEVVAELNNHPQADIIYSDEDKIDNEGRRFGPYFKTDWNPELFLSHNLISHFGVYRRSLVSKVGGFRVGLEGSQDYDLALRCVRATSAEKIRHIPAVLYHWRRAAQDSAFSERHLERCVAAARRAKAEYLASSGDGGEIVEHPQRKEWERVIWPVPQRAPLVSLIVPTRNRADLLGPCLDGLMNKTAYQPIEIVVVDHQSNERNTLALLKRVSADPRVRILHYEGPFNFSAMNNRAVDLSRGELVALVNNDIEVIAPDWLTEMVALAIRPENGAVGAKLIYPDGRVQHAGVGLGIGGVAGHFFWGVAADQAGYFGRLQLPSNVSAVTAACLVVKRSAYLEVGGLNETDLRVAFNDVDFCLKLREKGYRNVWTPFATLFHHESPSRGLDTTPEKAARFRREIEWMIKTWGGLLAEDPYFNPNLSLSSANFDLAFPPRRVKPWRGAAADRNAREAEDPNAAAGRVA